jgi:CRP-like cAMP-binding protein
LTNPIGTLIDIIEANSLWGSTITLNRNQLLKSEGRIDTNIYYVEKGSIRLIVHDACEEHTLRLGYKGSIVTALDSFMTGQPSDIIIQALKKSTFKVLSKNVILDLINSSEEHLRLWNDILNILILQQMEREMDILTSSPFERYQRVLKRSPKLFQEIPNKYIASYLRMTPETLSRIKKS